MINDFGEKIGLSRKDLWKRGLLLEDLVGMTDEEKVSSVKRDNIWPKPNMKKELESGLPRFVVFWKNEIHKQVYTTPRNGVSLEEYIHGVRAIMDMVAEIHTVDEIKAFYREAKRGKILVSSGRYMYTCAVPFGGVLDGKKFLMLSRESALIGLQKKMEDSGFGLTDEEVADVHYQTVLVDGEEYCPMYERGRLCVVRQVNGGMFYYYFRTDLPEQADDAESIVGQYLLLAGHNILLVSESEEACRNLGQKLFKEQKQTKAQKQGKKKWTPPHIDLKRVGPSVRDRDVCGQDFIEQYGVRGGEFGNWINDSERQASLNQCYDAFYDLADALGIYCKDISLPGLSLGSLAIAFGARGSGNAVAHYEPSLEVINITKLRGAGSLAHEWGHAMDDLIGKKMGFHGMASENYQNKNMTGTVKNLMKAIIRKNDGTYTDYFMHSNKYGMYFQKTGHGYWISECELFARAFSCYVFDKLAEKDRVNRYLCGHAHANYMTSEDGSIICAYPEGEERKKINRCFDELIAEMLEKGWFHDPVISVIKLPEKSVFSQSGNGQLSFFS